MRIAEERQASNIRIADCRVEVSHALSRTVERHPDLTYEEILSALLSAAEGQVGHMLAAAVKPDVPGA